MNIGLGSFCVCSQWTLETWKHFSPFRSTLAQPWTLKLSVASYRFLMGLVLLQIPHEITAIDLTAILVSP